MRAAIGATHFFCVYLIRFYICSTQAKVVQYNCWGWGLAARLLSYYYYYYYYYYNYYYYYYYYYHYYYYYYYYYYY